MLEGRPIHDRPTEGWVEEIVAARIVVGKCQIFDIGGIPLTGETERVTSIAMADASC